MSMITEVGNFLAGSLIGGLLTGTATYITFSTKLTRLTTKVENMEEKCAGCKSNTDNTLGILVRDFGNHKADEERHSSPASHQMLLDILNRVTRIETYIITKGG